MVVEGHCGTHCISRGMGVRGHDLGTLLQRNTRPLWATGETNSPEEGRSGGTGRGGGTKQQQPLAPKEHSWQVGPKSWHLPPSRLHADSKACVFQRVLNSGWIRNYKANSVSSDLEL